MKRHQLLFTLFFLLSTKVFSQSQDTVYVRDFVQPGTYRNCVEKIQKAIDACKERGAKVLLFEKGRYDIWPEKAQRREYFISNTSSEQECPSKVKTVGLLFERINGLEVIGQDALLMFHGKMIMMAFDQCRQIKVRSLRTDFERPTASEIKYVKKTGDGVEVALHRDTRYDLADGRLHLIGEGWESERFHCIEWDKDTHFFTYSSGWNTLHKAKAREVSPGIIHFDTPASFQPKIGNILTVRDIIRDQVGMFIKETSQITLQDLHIAYMHGLGIVSQYSTDITMDRVRCTPNEERGRILASSADFMHFSGCRGKITIRNCRLEGAHDDPINIHGTNLRIMEKTDSHTLRLRFMHAQSYGFMAFHAGDTVALVQAKTMMRCKTPYRVRWARKLSDREILVSFTAPVTDDFEIGHDCVENLSYTPEVHIHHNYFTRTSTRGLLVTTPRKVVIEDNVFEKTGMSAILIESDAEGWFESGPVKDVLIRNNTFIDCAYQGGPGNAVIALNPSNTVVDSRQPVHQNIRIVNNRFLTFDYPVLFAKSTHHLLFSGNSIERTHTTSSLCGNKNTFYFNGCHRVTIKDNQWSGWSEQPQTVIKNMSRKSIRQEGTVLLEQ